MKFSERSREDALCLDEQETGYSLRRHTLKWVPSYLEVTIRIPIGNSWAIVTGRDSYDKFFQQNDIQSHMKVCEIGAGLSGYLPNAVSHKYFDENAKPVIIDPIDYAVTEQLLGEGIDRAEKKDHPFWPIRHRLRQLLERCRIYQGGKIHHIRSTLREAVSQPSLLGSADVVLDICATDIYFRTQFTAADNDHLTDEEKAEKDRLFQEMRAQLLARGGTILPRSLAGIPLVQ